LLYSTHKNGFQWTKGNIEKLNEKIQKSRGVADAQGVANALYGLQRIDPRILPEDFIENIRRKIDLKRYPFNDQNIRNNLF